MPVLRQTIIVTLFVGLGAALCVTGWRVCGPYGATCSDAGQYFPTQDTDTNLPSGVVYDLSGDGVVETFVSTSAAGIADIAVDANEDGQIDRRLQPDRDGAWRQVDVPPVEVPSK